MNMWQQWQNMLFTFGFYENCQIEFSLFLNVAFWLCMSPSIRTFLLSFSKKIERMGSMGDFLFKCVVNIDN